MPGLVTYLLEWVVWLHVVSSVYHPAWCVGHRSADRYSLLSVELAPHLISILWANTCQLWSQFCFLGLAFLSDMPGHVVKATGCHPNGLFNCYVNDWWVLTLTDGMYAARLRMSSTAKPLRSYPNTALHGNNGSAECRRV